MKDISTPYITGSTQNVIVGAAALFISNLDSSQAGYENVALPTRTSGTWKDAFAGSNDWRNVGLTTDGLTVTYTPDYTDIPADQLLDAAVVFKTAMTVTLATSLTEATLENLLVSWAQSGDALSLGTGITAGTDFGIGADGDAELGISSGQLGDFPVERKLVAIGNAPRSASGGVRKERLYLARRCLNVEASAHSLSRTEATVFPVSFRLLPDPTFVGKEYGTIRDAVVS